MNTANICDCHCGTRIDLDEQLLEEREMWKSKYLCLQKQFQADIEVLKQNVYAECSGIMQQQFSQREADQNRIVNQKNVQIKDLISRAVTLESQLKVCQKEKELTEHRLNQLQREISQKDELIKSLQSNGSKNVRDWEIKHEEQLVLLRKKLINNSKEQLQKADEEKQQLKLKIKDFQQKYQKIIPEVEKMKANLAAKNAQIAQLEALLEKKCKQYEAKISDLKSQIDDLSKLHEMFPKHIRELEQNNKDLQKQMQKHKKASREIKVEAVYIDRPVQVQKVVQKIVQVQKVVKKFVDDPNTPKISQLQEQNNRLKEELNQLLGQIKSMQEEFQRILGEYEDNLKIHEENTIKYKKQRQNLAQRIMEQNKQIQMLESCLQKINQRNTPANRDAEKIVVHVKKDGTYQKTLQKLPNKTHTQNHAVPKKR